VTGNAGTFPVGAPSHPLENERRSGRKLVHHELDFKFWAKSAPGVDAARPASCPVCGQARRAPGRGLGLHGHGKRLRQVRGPAGPDGTPVTLVIEVRRYRCRGCSAVVTVVPRGVVPRRLFSAPAIAMALWRLGSLGESPALVRSAISPWTAVGSTAATGWAQLRRWGRAVARGVLFAGLPAAAGGATRAVARRVAMAVRTRSPSGVVDASRQVWLGALTL